jgi:thiol-disulfide isomerase/thioredoxin
MMKKLALLLCLLWSAAFAVDQKKDVDFELYDMGDKIYNTKQIRNEPGVKLLAVDFFSIHCEPCKKALPLWSALYKEYKAKGLEIILVVLPVEDDREKELQKIEFFFKNNPIPFPLAYDKYKLVGKKYGVVTDKGSAQVPQGFLVDRDGKLIFQSDGHAKMFEKIKATLK